MTSLEMENSTFTSWLDRLLSLWNHAIHPMNFWVHTAGTYRAAPILGRVHVAFFNYHHFNKMTHMSDQIVLARIMTALDLEFEVAHDKGYESDNDYGLPTQVMRPVHVYSVSTTDASFNPASYKVAQCPISPFTPRQPRDELPFHQGVHFHITFDETPPPRSGLQWWGISPYNWPW